VLLAITVLDLAYTIAGALIAALTGARTLWARWPRGRSP
jgi:hypothetical protein